MATGSARERGRAIPTLAVLLAALVVLSSLLWLFITIVETDTGWNEAIWQEAGLSRTLAWATTLCGSAGAGGGLYFALQWRSRRGRRPLTWFVSSLSVTLAAFAGWLVLLG